MVLASEYDKSKFLKAADLDKERKFRIKIVTEEEIGEGRDKEKKLVVRFTNDERGLVLNRPKQPATTAGTPQQQAVKSGNGAAAPSPTSGNGAAATPAAAAAPPVAPLHDPELEPDPVIPAAKRNGR